MAISNLTATPKDKSLALSWTVSTQVGDMIIVEWRYSQLANTPWVVGQVRLAPNANTFTITGLTDGVSYDVSVSQLQHYPALTTSAVPVAPGPIAPVLTVNADKSISWPAQAGVTAWKGAISTAAGGTGRTTTYVDIGNVTKWTPPAAPGTTLWYGLAAMPAGPWGAEVTITWPASPPTAKVQIGMCDGLGWGATQSAAALKAAHVTYIRANTESGQTSEFPANLIANGLTPGVVLIANTPDNTMLSKVDIPTWLAAALPQADDAVVNCGVSIPLEVGNEMYLKGGQAEPVAYAKMFDAIAKARPTYTFLWSMTGDYMRPDQTWSAQSTGNGWLGDAIAAVPALKTEIGGFISHPYGDMKPVPHNSANTWGPGALPPQHDFAVKLGCVHADKWYITEYGSSYPTAGDGDPQDVDCTVAYNYFIGLGYVRGIYWFQFRDYVGMTPPASGAFNDDFTPRPVVNSLKAFAIAQGQ